MIKYPKVNYIGNKEKVSEWICDSLPIKNGTVLDLFCGGCSLSFELKKRNYKVISNDILYSNYSLAKAIIENNNEKLLLDITEEKLEKYFDIETYEEIRWLENNLYFDYEVKELSMLINYFKNLKKYKKYIFLSLLRRAMIRKIPYSRMNIKWEEIVKLRDEEYSYLKYKRKRAYHNKTFLYHILDNLENYNNSIFDNRKHNKAYQSDAIKLLKNIREDIDLIYIDPPYPSTMNKYNEFYGSFDKMLNKEKEYINYAEKNQFLKYIKEIIKISRNKIKYAVISLNNKSNPTVENIIEVLKNEVIKIEILEKEHVYQITGKENKKTNYEILIICKLKE